MIPEVSGDLLQWLRGFYYVATTGSVSRAAEHMNRNQSAVSYQIQSLERELGVVLFLRLKNKMILTDDGERVFTWSLKIFDTVDGMQDELCSSQNRQGTCSIAGNRSSFCSLEFAAVIQQFHAKYPKIRLALNSGHPSQVFEKVRTGKCDFGFGCMNYPEKDIDFIKLFESPCSLVLSHDHPYTLDARPTIPQLGQLPYLDFTMSMPGEPMDYQFLPKESDIIMANKSYIACSNYYIIMDYVVKGMGCTLMDLWSVHTFSHLFSSLKIYNLDHLLPNISYGIIKRKNSAISSLHKELIDGIVNECGKAHLQETADHIFCQ